MDLPPPIERHSARYLTTEVHASYQLLDTAASSIWIIPKHTVRSLRSKLDSAYRAKDHGAVDSEVVRVVRRSMLIMFWCRTVCMLLVGCACLFAGVMLERGLTLNVYNPLKMLLGP